MADALIWTGTQWISLRGPAGNDGAAGADGAPGLPGADGSDGAPGLPGSDGAPGLKGDKGDDGVDGKDGKDGAGVTIVGPLDTYPPTATPNAGDMWIVVDPIPPGVPASAEGPAVVGDGVTFNGTTYTNVGRIQGPAGKDGKDGADGSDGAPGLPGSDGAKGDKGDDGAPGADGADGLNYEVYTQANEPTALRAGAIWFQI